MPHQIVRSQLRAALDAGSVTVVDALPAHAFAVRHLPGAVNLTEEDAPARAAPTFSASCTRSTG